MKKIAVAGAGLAIAVGAVAGPIAAVSAHPSAPAHASSHKVIGLKVKASGLTNVKKGGYVTLKVSKAGPNASYYCLMGIGVPFSKTKVAPYVGTLTQPTSSAAGTFTCKIKYPGKFSAKTLGAGKKKVSCPPTKAQAKQGYQCEITVADGASKGKKHNATYTFTVKK